MQNINTDNSTSVVTLATALPPHGRIPCSVCFKPGKSEGRPHPEWRMTNDPGAWGGQTPTTLVLGFSKGSTQADIYRTGRFDDVPFARMRPRLERELRHFGVLDADTSIDKALSDPAGDVAFGSLIRCSVARWDARAKHGAGEYGCSGALIKKSFDEIPDIISRCSERFLRHLPSSTREIYLLGNDTGYAERCQTLLKRLFPVGFRRMNEMCAIADGRLWVHIGHPSGSNGHFESWLTGDKNGKGRKRFLVEQALERWRSMGDVGAPPR